MRRLALGLAQDEDAHGATHVERPPPLCTLYEEPGPRNFSTEACPIDLEVAERGVELRDPGGATGRECSELLEQLAGQTPCLSLLSAYDGLVDFADRAQDQADLRLALRVLFTSGEIVEERPCLDARERVVALLKRRCDDVGVPHRRNDLAACLVLVRSEELVAHDEDPIVREHVPHACEVRRHMRLGDVMVHSLAHNCTELVRVTVVRDVHRKQVHIVEAQALKQSLGVADGRCVRVDRCHLEPEAGELAGEAPLAAADLQEVGQAEAREEREDELVSLFDVPVKL